MYLIPEDFSDLKRACPFLLRVVARIEARGFTVPVIQTQGYHKDARYNFKRESRRWRLTVNKGDQTLGEVTVDQFEKPASMGTFGYTTKQVRDALKARN